MGLSQSIINTEAQVAEVEGKAEVKQVEQVTPHIQISSELQTKTLNEIKVAEPTPTPKSSPIIQPITEDKKSEVFERYVEPPGKKIEVLPADVGSSTDVIRKRQ
jgi:hypothetical protein